MIENSFAFYKTLIGHNRSKLTVNWLRLNRAFSQFRSFKSNPLYTNLFKTSKSNMKLILTRLKGTLSQI